MNKNQKNIIMALIIWMILLPVVTGIIKFLLDIWEFTRDVSTGVAMFYGGLSFCLIWWIVEKIRSKK